jgi:peptidoglycan/xylan/chitin deacetylase (PgdA/CDA1 family)
MLRAVVLAYHGVGRVDAAQDPDRLVLDPDLLRSQVRLLRRLGYRFATAGDVLARHGGGPPPRGTAVLTFDDGWADALHTVLPLLRDAGAVASFYVCAGMWGGQHTSVPGEAGRLLTRDEARELHRAGMEVASHTLTHPDLRGLDDARLRAELVDARADVAETIGAPVTTLAYPFGLSDARVQDAARRPDEPRHVASRLAAKLLLGIRRPGR